MASPRDGIEATVRDRGSAVVGEVGLRRPGVAGRPSGLPPSIILSIYTQYDGKEAGPMSIRHALLALLSEGPKYGLQMRDEFEQQTGEVWPLNVGQVYTTLQRLERDGLVASDDAAEEGPQKGYRITPDGETELSVWLRTPPDLSSPPRDELVIKVLIALGLP